MQKIAIASDHAGFELKNELKSLLQDKGFEIIDFGTDSSESCDYPDYAHPSALAVESRKCDWGIGICGSGNGIAMTLNKHQGIRAAICWLPELASLARQHNDANFLVLPARFISKELAKEILESFIEAEFEGGRHERRVKKIPLNISVEGEVV